MDRKSDAGLSMKASRLFCFGDLNTLVDAIVELLKANTSSLESVVVLSEPSTNELRNELRFDQLRSSLHIDGGLSQWLSDHFKKHPALTQKFLRSELIAVSGNTGTNSHLQGIHASVVLVPVVHQGSVVAAFGLLSRGSGEPTMTDLEHVRWCALEAAQPLARMLELDSFRKESRKIRELTDQLSAAETTVQGLANSTSNLQALAAMRASLQSNVAHDMRTPLAAVRGYARMVLDGHAGEVSRTQKEYLEVAIENTNKIIHLVNWMSRVADAEQRMELTTFDLRELWKECVASHSWELGASSMRIEEALSGVPATFEILADKNKMQRAIHHLIRAAIQFGGAGTRLSLEFSRPKNGGVAVKLSGMQRAIPNDAAEFPFNGPLQHSLSDVNDIIGMHGGRFFVRKHEQESVFLFTLPAALSESKDAFAGRRSA